MTRTRALDHVSLTVGQGEVHGLLGLNGSGKSTLLNILFGNPCIRIDGGYTGEVRLGGKTINPQTPSQAAAAGIGMIHQEFALFDTMSVAANITLTREPVFSFSSNLLGRDFALVHSARTRTKAQQVLARLGLDLDVDILPSKLSVGMRQFVEVAREIGKSDLRLLLLDEPTAVLNEPDAAKLLDAVREFAAAGGAVLYVSHRLEEITALCDRMTVLRDGSIAGRFQRGCSIFDLARSMTGGDVVKVRKKRSVLQNDPALRFRNFCVSMPGEMLSGVDLDVHKGEVLGLAGLSGQGKLALAPGAMGLLPSAGTIQIHGETLHSRNSSQMIRRRVYYMPDDRRLMGLLLEHSVLENMVLPAAWNTGRFLRRFPLPGLRMLHRKACESWVRDKLDTLQIKCTSMHQKAGQLSGGNQQKVVIAQSLAAEPDILFVSEPTRGVDLQAKERILEILLQINEQRGATIVMASSELDELQRVCDRVAVIHGGKVSAILPPDADDQDFALAFSGLSEAVSQ